MLIQWNALTAPLFSGYARPVRQTFHECPRSVLLRGFSIDRERRNRLGCNLLFVVAFLLLRPATGENW